jgi:hypothetical protein
MQDVKKRCNEMYNDIWSEIFHLRSYISTLPEGVERHAYSRTKSMLEMFAELYLFQAMSIDHNYKTTPDKELIANLEKAKEYRATMEWLKKDLDDKAKDTEKVQDDE